MISSQFASCFSWLGSAWLPVVIFLGVLAIVLLYIGLRAQKRPKGCGEEEMIGTTGIIRRTAGFRGRATVEIRGEIWWCRSRYRLARDMEVKVTGINDMMLEVEPASGDGEGV